MLWINSIKLCRFAYDKKQQQQHNIKCMRLNFGVSLTKFQKSQKNKNILY